MPYLSERINLFGIVLNILLLTFDAIAIPWQLSVPEVNYQTSFSANTGFDTPSYPTANFQVPILSVPPAPTYPVTNYQPPVYTSSWQESQKSASTGYQGPMLTPTYGGRNNVYPITSNVGPNYSSSVQRPNYGYDQRNYAYPNTPQQTYAPNYDYGPRNYNYPNPTYVGSNQGSRSYDYPRSHPSPVQNIHTPHYGYDQSFSTLPHFGSNPMQATMLNHLFGPNESHVESNQVFDQRNYGFSSASRHETNTQPHLGDVN